MNDLAKGLSSIQQKLKAPKNQRNTFGNYNYRSCEDILEAVKPLLNGFILTLNDEICLIGERYYIKATVTLSDGENAISATAYAREGENRKGMDDSQLTGACSSYARKYALNGLFCIDDEKDADTKDNSHNEKKATSTTKEEKKGPSAEGLSKDILYKELSEYCAFNDTGEIDVSMLDNIVSTIAFHKDGKPVKTWKELDKIDGEKYSKWFDKILGNWKDMGKKEGHHADS